MSHLKHVKLLAPIKSPGAIVLSIIIRPWRVSDRGNDGAVLGNAEAKNREISRGGAALNGAGDPEPRPHLRPGRTVQVWPGLPQQDHARLQLGQT